MQNTTELPRLAISRNEAARQLDVSLDTIDRMVARGELEKIQVSTRKVAITTRSLLRLLPSEAA